MKFKPNNLRYIGMFFILACIFFVNSKLDDNKNKVSVACLGNSCDVPTKNSTLSDERPDVFISDIIISKPGYYYRLVIGGSVDHGTSLSVSVANSATTDQKEIGLFSIGRDEQFFRKEFIFKTEKKYNGLLVQKKDRGDGADIFVKDLKITQLDVSSDREANSLKSSVLGQSQASKVIIEQLESDVEFTRLKKKNSVFGQVFKAESDNITGIVFDVDVTKIDNRSGKKYKLELRKVTVNDEMFTVRKGPIASLDFNVQEIESYRQSDGKVRFPIYSMLEKGDYYFIGINNKGVDIGDQNYLILKGSVNNQYSDGTVLEKKRDPLYASNEDLYFKIYTAELERHRDEKILFGMTLEDLGGGRGSYTYKSLGYPEEIFDLLSFSQDISFNKKKRIIFGDSSNPNSYFEYKFDTRYPFKKFEIYALQPDSSWGKVRLLYSYDYINWKELGYDSSEGIQNYHDKQESPSFQKMLYIRVQPVDYSVSYYGLRDLVVTMDLLMR